MAFVVDNTIGSKETDKYELHLFSSEISSLNDICLSNQNLRTLIIIAQPNVTSLKPIAILIHLEELWAVECKIKELPDLNKCSKLKKIHLYSNEIEYIPNLTNCMHLKILNLAGNHINNLTNFNTIKSAEELNLANNKLKRLNGTFLKNSQLSYLNLAGNPLYHLKDVKNLAICQKLNSIVFADPLYGNCPLVYLCNYRCCIIYFLLRARRLDHYSISDEERRYAINIFTKQKMQHNLMLHKYINAYLSLRRVKKKQHQENIAFLKRQLQGAKNEFLRGIDLSIELNKQLDEWEQTSLIHLQVQQYQLKLSMNYCGNVNFTEYTLNDENTIVKMCQKTLETAFCTSTREYTKLSGIHIHRIIKIVNKEIDEYHRWNDIDDSLRSNKNMKSFKLLLVSPVALTDTRNWLFNIEMELFEQNEILLTNCLGLADIDWLNKNNEMWENLPGTIDVRQKRRVCVILRVPDNASLVKDESIDKFHAKDGNNVDEICQKFRLTKEHIRNPFYLIEYEYTTQVPRNEVPLLQIISKEFQEDEQSPPRNTIFQNLSTSNITQYLGISEKKILNLVKINLAAQNIRTIDVKMDLPNLKELDISHNKLTIFPDIQILKFVKILDISFNNIDSIYITKVLLMLRELNISWNCLTSLKNFQTFQDFIPNLRILHTENNPFRDVFNNNAIRNLLKIYLPKLYCINGVACKDDHVSFKNYFPCALNMCEGFYKRKKNHIHLPSYTIINWEDIVNKNAHIQELCAINCAVTKVSLQKSLHHLVKINLSNNFITVPSGLSGRNLPTLRYLDLTHNSITSLQPMETFSTLHEFYCAHNKINDMLEIRNIRTWYKLNVIDLCDNPIAADDLYKNFIVFYLKNVKYVSGECIKESDTVKANHVLGNVLNKITLSVMYGIHELSNIKQLSIIDCSIKEIDFPPNTLPLLESLDLSKNQITSLWDFRHFQNLHTLRLSNNSIETLNQVESNKDYIFPKLCTLYIDHNRITSLKSIKKKMPILMYLFLHYNHLHNINGIRDLKNLQILVLDHNKIERINEYDFNEENNIKYMFLEYNKIKYLHFTKRLIKLEKLFLANNLITDNTEFQYLKFLENLEELSIANNPLCMKMNCYNFCVENFRKMKVVDGYPMCLEHLDVLLM